MAGAAGDAAGRRSSRGVRLRDGSGRGSRLALRPGFAPGAATASATAPLAGLFSRLVRPRRAAGKPGDLLHLDLALDELLDGGEQRLVLVAHDRDRLAFHARAAGAADAVHVVLRHVGHVEVDHVGQRLDVEAPRRDVRGDEHAHLVGLEALQGLDARVLALVAVDRGGVDAVLLELVGEAVGAVLGLAEDEDLLPVVRLDQVREQVALALGIDEVRPLRDRFGRRVAARHLDRERVVQELRRKPADLVGERGREEQRLPLARQQVEDALDVGDEAHVQHAVGFVQHQDRDLAQVHRLLAREVQQAPGRGHQDLDALPQLLDLGVDVDAAVDAVGLEGDVLSVGLHALVDLDGQLPRGREDEAAHRVQRGREALARHRGEALEQRQREAGGLAGARLGGAEQVAAGKHHGNGLLLDGGGFGVTLFRDGAEELGQKPETFESLADGCLLKNRPGEAWRPRPVQADEWCCVGMSHRIRCEGPVAPTG